LYEDGEWESEIFEMAAADKQKTREFEKASDSRELVELNGFLEDISDKYD
jgi:hypothetical protein